MTPQLIRGVFVYTRQKGLRMATYTKTSCPHCKATIQNWTPFNDNKIGPPTEKCESCGHSYLTGRKFYCEMTPTERTIWSSKTIFSNITTTIVYSISGPALFSVFVGKILEYFGVSVEFTTGLYLVLLLCIVTAIIIGTLFYEQYLFLKKVTPNNYCPEDIRQSNRK